MLKPSLQLRLSQQLTMTPQLQQAIRLLPVMELQAQIEDALEQNIMLEAEDPPAGEAPEQPASEETAESTIEETPWDEVARTGPAETYRSADPTLTFEQPDRSGESLAEHL